MGWMYFDNCIIDDNCSHYLFSSSFDDEDTTTL